MIKITKTDERKEKEGVWTEYFGVNLLIARFPQDVLMRRLNNIRKQSRTRELDIASKRVRDVTIEVIAEHVLLDWSNFSYDYSTENAVKLLQNDRDCLDFVSEFSREYDNFLEEDEDQTVGE